MNKRFIIDGHLDLSMNAMEWNRDFKTPVSVIRRREQGKTDKPDRGNGMVSLPELRAGRSALVVATQIARYVAEGNLQSGWHSPEQAWAQTQGQLAWYQAMVDAGEMAQITNPAELEHHLSLWQNDSDDAKKPVGFILSLEGPRKSLGVWVARSRSCALWSWSLCTRHEYGRPAYPARC
jgi:membrane dipeptidase